MIFGICVCIIILKCYFCKNKRCNIMRTFHHISAVLFLLNIVILLWGFSELDANMVIGGFVALPFTITAALWSSDIFNGDDGNYYGGYWPF